MRTNPNFELKMALMKRGISQRDLAFGCGIDESRISKFIRGYEVPTRETQRVICKFIGVEAEEIFSGA